MTNTNNTPTQPNPNPLKADKQMTNTNTITPAALDTISDFLDVLDRPMFLLTVEDDTCCVSISNAVRKHLQGIDGGATYVGDVSNYGTEDKLSAWAMRHRIIRGWFESGKRCVIVARKSDVAEVKRGSVLNYLSLHATGSDLSILNELN